MRARAISREALVEELAERIAGLPRDSYARVAVDGAPPAHPERLADELVAPLRTRGRAVLRVSAADFLRPASLRLEYGRTDPDAFYDDWLDTGGLTREVLGPLGPQGTGKVLPALWDSRADRAYRLPYQTLPQGAVLLLDGTLLLGRGLPFEVSAHLWLSEGALGRMTGEDERWRLPAYARYEREADPLRTADVAVRADHPGRMAILIEDGR
ncbi:MULTISPECIES: uridine kinase [unclassified Nonomuraea]|uniref:uridine kinase n=1 Tax=unclassified Nonomuraea TaxID=2593643 RepID=UPI0033D1F1E2